MRPLPRIPAFGFIFLSSNYLFSSKLLTSSIYIYIYIRIYFRSHGPCTPYFSRICLHSQSPPPSPSPRPIPPNHVFSRRVGLAPCLQEPLNGVAWAPHSGSHLCTVSDDRQALIWDISHREVPTQDPILAYAAGGAINSLSWTTGHEDWVAITFNDCLQILRV